MPNLYPGSITARVAPPRFLIGESRQAAQVTPVGAGRVTAIKTANCLPIQLAGAGSRGVPLTCTQACRFPGLVWSTTQGACPLVRMVAITAGSTPIQIYENVSGIGRRPIGLQVYVAAFPIAQAEKVNCSGMGQLGRGPQPFSGKCSAGLGMNQADEVKVVRHGRELAVDGRQGQMESAIERGPILESE